MTSGDIESANMEEAAREYCDGVAHSDVFGYKDERGVWGPEYTAWARRTFGKAYMLAKHEFVPVSEAIARAHIDRYRMMHCPSVEHTARLLSREFSEEYEQYLVVFTETYATDGHVAAYDAALYSMPCKVLLDT